METLFFLAFLLDDGPFFICNPPYIQLIENRQVLPWVILMGSLWRWRLLPGALRFSLLVLRLCLLGHQPLAVRKRCSTWVSAGGFGASSA